MDLQKQLTKHLTDVHSIEEQALQQMLLAPRMARDPELARAFRLHQDETRDQRQRVRARLEARSAEPSRAKDIAGRAGGIGMVLFARSQPDMPGKLVAHAYSYEHMEMAAYDLLAQVADRAGDHETAEMARSIREQEATMAKRLEDNLDRAAEAALREVDPDDLDEQLNKYLRDAHAVEAQALQLLSQGAALANDADLRKTFENHLEETRSQQEAVRARLEARDTGPSRVKDVLLRVGGLNIGGFFGAQPDTPVKLAGFAFAFEHLEVASYELLRRVAERAGDQETARVAERIIGDERAAAAQFRARFDSALDTTRAAAPRTQPRSA